MVGEFAQAERKIHGGFYKFLMSGEDEASLGHVSGEEMVLSLC